MAELELAKYVIKTPPKNIYKRSEMLRLFQNEKQFILNRPKFSVFHNGLILFGLSFFSRFRRAESFLVAPRLRPNRRADRP
ncbi:hypothetical protein HMPREF1870_01282 [Bacteroidales bacterium KA00344]|nr:hypothetical protein HMPREF1870_01282 [Bacteroidales bacterium KA00344]